VSLKKIIFYYILFYLCLLINVSLSNLTISQPLDHKHAGNMKVVAVYLLVASSISWLGFFHRFQERACQITKSENCRFLKNQLRILQNTTMTVFSWVKKTQKSRFEDRHRYHFSLVGLSKNFVAKFQNHHRCRENF
jgi:hypothetical protein